MVPERTPAGKARLRRDLGGAVRGGGAAELYSWEISGLSQKKTAEAGAVTALLLLSSQVLWIIFKISKIVA